MSVADPPIPLPPELAPQVKAPLAGADERVALSTEELRALSALLDAERLSGQTLVTLREGSPWVELAVAVPYHVDAPDHPGAEAAVGGRVYRYVLWRYSCAIWRVDEDGALQRDPVIAGRPD